MTQPVIYNNGAQPTLRPCRDCRPIPVIRLRRRLIGLWVQERIDRDHQDHYLPEAGCPRCAEGSDR